MKLALVVFAVLILAGAATAQTHTVVRDKQGKRIATIQEEPGGGTSLRARDGAVIGRIDQHGILRDRSGKRIGAMTPRH